MTDPKETKPESPDALRDAPKPKDESQQDITIPFPKPPTKPTK